MIKDRFLKKYKGFFYNFEDETKLFDAYELIYGQRLVTASKGFKYYRNMLERRSNLQS